MSAEFADFFVNLHVLLIYCGLFIFLSSSLLAAIIYRKLFFLPLLISFFVGIIGVLITIKPGGWNFQYAASPFVIGLWGGAFLLLSTVFRLKNKIAVFINAVIPLLLFSVIFFGLFVQNVKYSYDRKFWRLAASSDTFNLDTKIYKKHLTKEGIREIESLKYNGCDKNMSQEFVTLLFNLGINVNSCNNTTTEIKNFYKNDIVNNNISRCNGFGKYIVNYGTYNDIKFCTDEIILLNDSYKKSSLIDAGTLCAGLSNLRIYSKDIILFAPDVIDYEIDRINLSIRNEKLVNNIDDILVEMSISAISGNQLSSISKINETIKEKHKNASGIYPHKVDIEIIKNNHTPDEIFYKLFDMYYDSGWLTEFISSTERIEKDKFIDYMYTASNDKSRYFLKNKMFSEEEIFYFIESQTEEDFILGGLETIADMPEYDLDRFVKCFKNIDWRLGGTQYDVPYSVLEALIKYGYDENKIFSNYLNSSASRERKIKFITDIDSATKEKIITRKYGSPVVSGNEYILNYLEQDTDSKIAGLARDYKKKLVQL